MKSKIIAVQEGLHGVAARLKKDGYRVTNIDDNTMPIDVIIYSSQNQDYLAHNMSGMVSIADNNKYVKMINLDEIGIDNLNMSIEELD